MLRLSIKLLYAIEAVVDIAYHSGAEPVRSSEISEREGIPRRYLEQVLQHLVHHGILAGQSSKTRIPVRDALAPDKTVRVKLRSINNINISKLTE